ncbi:MAG: ATP-dependent sacrificial sulfur transferase LarE [Leptospirales bacterium]
MTDLTQKYETLLEIFRAQRSALIAFSGGVDSAFALKAALDALGTEKVLAITAVSAAVPAREREEAAKIAAELGARHRFVDSNEIERPGYAANGFDRCFHCKSELYEILKHVASREGHSFIANGANTDDLGDHRPGQTAAGQNGVHSPLIEAGFRKADIRALAKDAGLRIWDKPASPCLSSRIPYNSPVTVKKLNQIEAAEQALRDQGFREFRVRHHERIARIEVHPEEMPRFLEAETRAEIVATLRGLGFLYVSLDLGGFQSGNLNREVPDHPRATDAKRPRSR